MTPVLPAGLLRTIVLGLLLVAGGCSERPAEAPPSAVAAPDGTVDVRQVSFAPELGVDLDAMTRTDEGIHIQDIREGRGAQAEPGRLVSIEYSGWLPDGTLFEQRPSPDGFGLSEFVLGENPPVAGLNTAIAGMRTGGVRRIVLPPEHGYGLVGRPEGVPANAVLIFEVRLLGAREAPRVEADGF
jgi:FKBP-type peptidyl-prolyl cis-trans isomerase FkpA